MKLSVIIVNYNVKYFLEQSLHAVAKALQDIEAEVFVVDNASADGSVAMVQEKFPWVNLIVNERNLGFSKANNQAIRLSRGEYILLLNPDTVVQEDTFKKTIAFMDAHPEAGALGVKMLDGKGKFLPESKRSLPTPEVAFYKLFGLAYLFPKSRLFGKYHLGYLQEDAIHEVEVLSGAFMLLRKKVLDEVGLLDEDFFMYGEDIDLSYRILKAGYKNYFFPHTQIIHYKGESTKRGSLNYVQMFYKAMAVFVRKHFSSGRAHLFGTLIYLAIWFRAALAAAYQLVTRFWLPVADIALLYGGMYLLKDYWEKNHRYVEGGQYPPEFMGIAVPAYIAVWVASIYFNGGYDTPLRITKAIRGVVIGTIIIGVMYAFIPNSWRFSRALIVLGTAWAVGATSSIRLLVNLIRYRDLSLAGTKKKRVLVVGSNEEASRVLDLLRETQANTEFLGYVTPRQVAPPATSLLGHIGQLEGIVELYKTNEIIFCTKDISAQQIIAWMSRLGPNIDYKIIPEDGLSIIGSNSARTTGELYAIDINLAVVTPVNKRNKRLLDIALTLLFLLFFPIFAFIVNHPRGFLRNCLSVLIGRKSWVGYASGARGGIFVLPPLRPGVLSPLDTLKQLELGSNAIGRLNLLYAKNYSIWEDVTIVLKGFRSLGREPAHPV